MNNVELYWSPEILENSEAYQILQCLCVLGNSLLERTTLPFPTCLRLMGALHVFGQETNDKTRYRPSKLLDFFPPN